MQEQGARYLLFRYKQEVHTQTFIYCKEDNSITQRHERVSFNCLSTHRAWEGRGGAVSAGQGGFKHRENEACALTRHHAPYFQVTTGCERGTLLPVHVFRPEFQALLVLRVPGGSFMLLVEI